MANCMFCWPDFSQDTATVTPVITGPAAWSDLPLLKGDVLSEMARCNSTLLADTQLTIDMGTTRAVRTVVFPKHSAGINDKARVRVATDAAFTNVLMDSGWLDFYGAILPFGSLSWGDPSFWTGRLTAEQAAGYPLPWVYIAPQQVYGRYVKIEIDATSNPAGFLDLARAIVSPGWQPRYNMSYGAQIGWLDDTPKKRSKGGVDFYDVQPKRRRDVISLDWLSVKEAMGGPFEMQRVCGTHSPFFFVFDSADQDLMYQRSFLCTMRELAPFEYPHFDTHRARFALEEVI